MTLELPLARLQRWMQSVVVHPGAVEEAVLAAEAQAELAVEQLPQVILPSAHLQPIERVAIYHGMYLLRMEEALAGDYPALKHFLGPDGFFELVRGYVQAYPSRSFTLNPLGAHLPEYVRTTAEVARRAFCHDLARLELAITEVFDAPETPALDEETIAAVAPPAWERARLVPVAAFRLLALRYPAGAYLDSLRSETHEHPPTRRQDTWVAIYRRAYAVYRHELGAAAHGLLADLLAGETVGEAVGAALKRRGRARPQAEDLFRWFRQWAAAGMFAEVRLD